MTVWFIAIAAFVLFAVLLTLAAVLRVSSHLHQQMGQLTQQVNDRLKESSTLLAEGHRTVGERLDSATRVFGDVQKSLGRLEETHRQIYDIGRDIASLQELLRAPKFRGELGETLLGRLLEDILPKEHIRLQHRFKSGDIADAVIIVGSNLISIDAKFPLENFRKSADAPAEEEKRSFYRVFVRDVKKRIDEVSAKYILPDEGTFDFALMYIPAEAVYYQISRDEELTGYAQQKKVVFVSPNTFYAYLQAILYGLRGVNIQRNIQKVLAELNGVSIEFGKLREDFNVAGRHLSDASNRFTQARERLEKFGERLLAALQRPPAEMKPPQD